MLLSAPPARAQRAFAPQPTRSPNPPTDHVDEAPERPAPKWTLSRVSRLPVPAGAEVWVDAESNGPVVQHASVLVIRPRGDVMSWESWTGLLETTGVLAPETTPLLRGALPGSAPSATRPMPGSGEYRVFRTPNANEFLVLRLQKNPTTTHLTVSAVLLSGRVDAARAAEHAETLVAELTAKALAERETVPAPPGSTPAAREIRFSGAQLRSMLGGILQDPSLSPRVKEMSRVVLPQATSLRFSVWRTEGSLTDRSFFDFYTQQGARLGWGPPLSRDETQPSRPVLLFQRPNNEGVIMVRAQPAPSTAAGTPRAPARPRPATHIFILVIEGKIDASSLATR